MTDSDDPSLAGSAPSAPAAGARSSAPGGLRSFGRVVLLVLRAVGRFFAPAVGVVSGTGWVVLGAALLTGAAGFALGWQELVYLAVTLLGGMVVAVLFIFGRSTFAVTIELSPRRVVVGERAFGRMLVTNLSARRSTPTRFELGVGAALAEFSLPSLASKAEHESLFAVPTNRRAVIVAGPAVSVRGDQLGLLRRTVRWTDPVELFVHPVTVPLAPSAAGLVRDLEGEITKTITNNDISFHALRAYEPGDDRRNVHWRTSARTGQLMVRQFEETRRSQLSIIHSTSRASYASDEEFELAVSVTASLGVQVLRDGTRIDVVSESMALRTTTPSSLLDDSCRLELAPSPFTTTREFARVSTARLAHPSVAMLVSGSLLPIVEMRAVDTLFGSDTQTIGFRIELGAQPRIARVAGLAIVTVGALTDLPRLVRRVR
jgi:hypothetical protein